MDNLRECDAGSYESNVCTNHSKQFSTGFTVSRVIDPLIISTSIHYSHFLRRELSTGYFKPGNILTVTPTIGFAVNPDINISWGIGFSYKAGDEFEGEDVQQADILTTMNVGFGYRLAKDRLLKVSGQAGVGGNNAVQFNVNMSQRF